ncbi:MAG: DNA repair exonuclease [Gemmatimonadota bacterium]|nr:DNA repair exonuclease [Gemmatimonadota bacterium]
MRLVHLADLHVGYRQYQRLTPAGINQREADVGATFKRVIDRTIELQPEIVLIAGDVFHSVRPSNPAILHAFTQFSRLVNALPAAKIVMIAGNHDTPRTAETGCILHLFTPLGIHVVEGEAKRLEFPDIGVSVLAVPDVPAGLPALTPDPAATHNVLLLHGEVEGVLPEYARRMERATIEITRDELAPARWDYVALGHYHVHREVAPNAYYAGSIDYTSANPWGEMHEERDAGIHLPARGGKGIIEWDLLSSRHTFHPLSVSRPLVDLPRLDGTGMTAAELDAAVRERVESSRIAIDEHVVRLVVTDVPRHIARQMDPKAVRDLKRRALHFNLDVRPPETVHRTASGAPGRRQSLTEVLKEKLQSRPLSAEIQRGEFVALGLEYLNRSDATTAATLGESA